MPRIFDFWILNFGKFQSSFFELQSNGAQEKGCDLAFYKIKCAKNSKFVDFKILGRISNLVCIGFENIGKFRVKSPCVSFETAILDTLN